ncbi:hypothetical protein EYF80_026579 [Liparis tanakae]|uniref:Uncharacterized protein n=1 Tax=Liparis tanakae TaxID=230148 RepID=A0A4Z2HBU8_9TELE|nr:hypothetical protein EYF80_026579 [Liparis tanakae]
MNSGLQHLKLEIMNKTCHTKHLEALRSPVPAKVRAGDLLEAVCGPEEADRAPLERRRQHAAGRSKKRPFWDYRNKAELCTTRSSEETTPTHESPPRPPFPLTTGRQPSPIAPHPNPLFTTPSIPFSFRTVTIPRLLHSFISQQTICKLTAVVFVKETYVSVSAIDDAVSMSGNAIPKRHQAAATWYRCQPTWMHNVPCQKKIPDGSLHRR